MIKSGIVVVSLTLLLAGCSGDAPNDIGDTRMNTELTSVIDDYFEAWLDGRVTDMVRHFTEDSAYHPNGGKSVVGKAALREFYQAFVDDYDIELNWHFEAAESERNLGYVMGVYFIRYSPKGADEPIARGGRFYMQMRKVDGRWLIARELTQTTEDADGA